MLVLRCYGFCTVLNSPGCPADWLPGRPGGRSEGEARESRSTRESKRGRGSSFKLSDFGPTHRRLVESECPYGAEPRLHSPSCKAHDHSSSDISFNVKGIHRSFMSVVNIHYDAKV